MSSYSNQQASHMCWNSLPLRAPSHFEALFQTANEEEGVAKKPPHRPIPFNDSCFCCVLPWLRP